MRKIGAWLAPGMAALALLSTPLCAQEAEVASPQADARSDERPLAGFTAEQIAAFFTVVAATPEIDAAIGPVIEQMFTPGEPVAGWREAGIDILAELDAREGGRAANLLRDTDTEVLSITDLSGKAAPDMSGYAPLTLRAAPPGAADERVFASFEPGMWLELAYQRKPRGTAICYGGLMGLTLHSKRPLTDFTTDELFMTIVVVSLFDRVAAREYCVIYERDGEGYRTRSFLPDGRALPQIDAESTPMQIMPASGLAAVIRDGVPTLSAQ